VTARIDWLAGRAVVAGSKQRDPRRTFFVGEWSNGRPDAGFARSKYRNWHEDGHGTKIAFAKERPAPDDNCYVIVKGRGLSALRSEGLDDAGIILAASSHAMIPARIDLAIDTQLPEISPMELARLWRANRIVSRLETRREYQAEGSSFYLQSNERVFRAYDKTAERASAGESVPPGTTRLELELRGKQARQIWPHLVAMAKDGSWSERFAPFAGSAILAAVRPIEGERPEHNPQRAPVWKPFAAALAASRPLRLPAAAEQHERNIHETLAQSLEMADRYGAAFSLFHAVLMALPPEQQAQALAQMARRMKPEHHNAAALLQDPKALSRFAAKLPKAPKWLSTNTTN
jgi:hypothetical protein